MCEQPQGRPHSTTREVQLFMSLHCSLSDDPQSWGGECFICLLFCPVSPSQMCSFCPKVSMFDFFNPLCFVPWWFKFPAVSGENIIRKQYVHLNGFFKMRVTAKSPPSGEQAKHFLKEVVKRHLLATWGKVYCSVDKHWKEPSNLFNPLNVACLTA